MASKRFHRTILSIALPVGVLLLLMAFSQSFTHPVSSTLPACKPADKQKGAHFYGIRDSSNFDPLTRNHIEWVTLIAWASLDDFDSPRVDHHRGDRVDVRKRDSLWLKRIDMVHSKGFKVFVKPHVWIDRPTEGKWRSDVFPRNDADWESWQQSYREYILRYAKIAEKGHAEMFCIGVEFSRLAVEKPEFWKGLIAEVRGVYSGKLTYAANWHGEFEEITFWEDLDYIGIQAYFPLARTLSPSFREVSRGWDQHLPTLENISQKFHRKIIFTELGYKSTANSAQKPWEWLEHTDRNDDSYSPETQANCYAAFFHRVWPQDWFAGVHLWVLQSYLIENDPGTRLDFTPLGKPAEAIIARGFK